jgi:recombination protein RecT
MDNATKTPVRRVDILKKTLGSESVQEQFKNALGTNSNSFIASIIDLYTGDASLQSCDPNLVVAQALKAAVLKLPLTKALGFAYIVVFNNSVRMPDGSWQKVPVPTFIPGYRGYIQMAMRTGQYKTLNADVVYDGELRRVNKLTGEIALDGEKKSDKIEGYFAYFELLNGYSKTLFMTVDQMARHAKQYSPSIKSSKDVSVDSLKILANSNQSTDKVGWLGNFTEMALKTCMRNLLSRWGYLSVEMQSAITMDSDEAQESRDNAIADIRPKHINVEDVSYEEAEKKPEYEDAESPY